MAHSFSHVYEEMVAIENIKKSIKDASRGKRDRKDVKKYYKHGDFTDEAIDKVLKYVKNFKSCKHSPVLIYDGVCRKKRTIIVPKFKEEIIHHMVGNILREYLEPEMYEWSLASIPGRGSHKGKRKIEKWIKEDKRGVKYCLKMDIRKFFDSIPHDILIRKLEKKFHDPKFMDIMKEIISVTGSSIGIPLGFYTSQWLANYYLTEMDHFIKETLGAKYYIRYMDDMVIFGPKKRILHKYHDEINRYLQEELGLRLKDNWQVFRFDHSKGNKKQAHCLDFMGFKFYHNKIVMRKSIMIRCSKKARKLSKKDRVTIYDTRQILSYLGWINATDTYGMYVKYIKPNVSFGKCKRDVSRYDKRKAKNKDK